MKVLSKIKKTSLGRGGTWLIHFRKHYEDVKMHLQEQMPYPPSKQQIRWCFWDYFRFLVVYGGQLGVDYFGAQLYRKSDFVRRESLAHAARYPWRDALQERAHWSTFLDKREFYQAFSECLHRPWMILEEDTSWESFAVFAEECGYRVFSKEPVGYGGKGVRFWELNSEEEMQQLFALRKEQPLVLEGRLTQCKELYEFSNGAVNTLRIITLIDQEGRAHVARSELRMGRKDMVVDNFSSGGLVAQVDVETGVIFGMGKDERGRDYIFHPDSGKQIVGFTIPDWEGYKAFVCMLAGKFPGMRYVGWDIIQDDHGNFCVIEGNKDAGVGGLESSLLYGLRPQFEAILRADQIK